MPKGKKTCSNCGTETGPRAYICGTCKTPFDFAMKTKRSKTTNFIKKFDWSELVKGQTVRVTGGPYFITNEGEYIPMGYRGIYTVISTDRNGIVAANQKDGFVHIYMGHDEQSPETKINKTAHKIILLEKKVKQ